MNALPGIQMTIDDRCMSMVHAVKDEQEIEKMIASSKINDQVMLRLRRMLREGITEKEIYDRMEEIYKECGADRMAFAGVCFGENSAQPHHILPEERRLRRGDTEHILFILQDMVSVWRYMSPEEEWRQITKTVCRWAIFSPWSPEFIWKGNSA